MVPSRTRVLLLLPALLASASPALAAEPNKPAPTEDFGARVTQLAADVAELAKLAAELPSMQRALGDVTAQAAALRADLDAIVRAGAAEADERRHLEELEAREGELAREVAALRSEVASAGAAQAAAESAATYKDGFLLATADGRFSLRTKGYVQLRHLLRMQDGHDDPVESSALLRQARIAWDGNVYSPRLGYKLFVELAQSSVQLLDAYVEGAPVASLSLRGGQFKVPFSRDFLTSDEVLSFLERSVAVDEFRYDRDVGLMVTARAFGDRLEATAGVWNGAGKNVRANDNLDPLVAARFTVAVLGKLWKPEEGDFDDSRRPALLLGGGVTFENAPSPKEYGYRSGGEGRAVQITKRDVDGDGRDDNVQVEQANLELAFRFRGLGIETEGFVRREDWGILGDSNGFVPEKDFLGGYAQASYFVVPQRFQVGARAAYAEVSPLSLGGKKRDAAKCQTGMTSFDCTLPLSDTRQEISVLAAYYRHRHGIELSAMYSFFDYDNRHGDAPTASDEHRVIVETQIAF